MLNTEKTAETTPITSRMSSKRKKQQLPFDRQGGVISINRRLLESNAFITMQPTAKVLFLLLHTHWRPDRPVSYGVREAAKNINCTPTTASKAFKILEYRGFIVCEQESLFNSRTGSRARDWRLTWMPYSWVGYTRDPSNEWEQWADAN